MKPLELLLDATLDEDAIEPNDGHTANRTKMLPWESCGPECRLCAELEK
jgi:hypothetical protein